MGSTRIHELFGPGTRGTSLGEEVPLDGIGTSVTIIMFRAHLPECMRKGHQAFLPCNDGTLSAIQLPLPNKELLLQLDDHPMRRRQSPIQSTSKSRCHDKEASSGEGQHKVKTHLAGGEARLEEVSVLA
jgi:hypothetical protein